MHSFFGNSKLFHRPVFVEILATFPLSGLIKVVINITYALYLPNGNDRFIRRLTQTCGSNSQPKPDRITSHESYNNMCAVFGNYELNSYRDSLHCANTAIHKQWNNAIFKRVDTVVCIEMHFDLRLYGVYG